MSCSRAALIKVLAAAGKTASMIAREIGISHQRVSQITSAHRISVPRHVVSIVYPSGPAPKVMTGGVQVPANATVAGTVGEILVTADLLARGWFVYTPVIRQRNHDLIASRGDTLVTIEVRAAARAASGQLMFRRGAGDKSAVYALVVTGEPVIYQPDDWLMSEIDAVAAPGISKDPPYRKEVRTWTCPTG